MHRPFLLTRVLPACVVAVLALVALTACGSSGSSDAASTTAAPTNSDSNAGSSAFAKYTACLKQHGVTVPSFAGGRRSGNGGPPTGRRNMTSAQRTAFQKAQSACASLRPSGAFGGPGPGGGRNSQASAAFDNCLKLNGVTLTGNTRPDQASAKVKKAMAACASLRPSPSAGGQPPTSTNTNQG